MNENCVPESDVDKSHSGGHLLPDRRRSAGIDTRRLVYWYIFPDFRTALQVKLNTIYICSFFER